MQRILVIDDDVAVTNYLMVFFMQTGRYDPTILNESRGVPALLEQEGFDLVLLDMDMPDFSGMDVLRLMRDRGISTPVIILTGVSDVTLAVRAMKLGAFDYLTKPVDEEHLLEVMDRAMEHQAVQDSIRQLPTEPRHEDLAFQAAFEQLPTQDPAMIRLFHQAERMALTDLAIFIWGEPGSGKELLARAIHNASPRREGPFIPVDVSAEDPARFTACFFGQARSWNGEREERPGFLEEASGGTLFLDGIEHLPLPAQVRLKRVLQTGEYYQEDSTRILTASTRFIVASTHDLARPEWVDRFSRDLLYHLVINSIRIPPLRDRPQDIPLLMRHFVEREARRTGRPLQVAHDLETCLMGYAFPNNVQELQTIMSGAVANAEGDTVTVEALPHYIRTTIVGPIQD